MDSAPSSTTLETSADLRKDAVREACWLSEILDRWRSNTVEAAAQITEDAPPASVLTRLLSLDPVISTASPPSATYISRHEAQKELQVGFRKIGFGQCGLVFERPGRGYIVKLARPFFHDSLWNDFLVHSQVSECFEKQSSTPRCIVPAVYSYVAKYDEDWWEEYGPLLEKTDDFPTPTMVLVTERILPLPKAARNALIKLFCAEELQESAKSNPLNRDCLARVYLGRHRPNAGQPTPNFSLRNFNLHLDQMLDLRLPVNQYARAMAESLAIIHWSANVDGYDIEFVLGSEPETSRRIYSKPLSELLGLTAQNLVDMPPHQNLDRMVRANHRGSLMRLWVLDFNLCTRFKEEAVSDSTQHPALLEQLVLAFFENDPYYPLPMMESDVEKNLWSAFRNQYLRTSGVILASKDEVVRELPSRFIDACEQREQAKLSAGLGHGHRDLKG